MAPAPKSDGGLDALTAEVPEAASQPVAAKKKEVLIEGRIYDVTDFRHPGGSIIRFLTNSGDATETFQAFHGRSKYARKLLQSRPSRAASEEALAKFGVANGRPALAADFAKLRAELEADGMFEPSPTHMALRYLELLVMHVVGVALCLRGGLGMWVAGLVVLGIASGRCGWLMHEAGHYSLTGNIKRDRRLQEVTYGVGCGMSAAWWRSQHNKHHAAPQKLEHDVDLDTLPLLAFNARIAQSTTNPIARAWLKMQAVLFVPITCLLVGLFWQLFLHPRHAIRTKRGVELGSFALRYTIATLFMYSFGCTLKSGIAWYLFYGWVATTYIFTNFSVSHTHLPVVEADKQLHWVEYAAKHTTNITHGWGWFTTWWMCYLNFQIEHHLFPDMPQYRHPTIAPKVRALFEKHGMRYDLRPYFSCLRETFNNLHSVGNPESHGKAE